MIQGAAEMVPTAKGVSINVTLFQELKKAIAEVETILKENRMIKG
jgi:ribosomal protein L29